MAISFGAKQTKLKQLGQKLTSKMRCQFGCHAGNATWKPKKMSLTLDQEHLLIFKNHFETIT